jgi:hypothetical protein
LAALHRRRNILTTALEIADHRMTMFEATEAEQRVAAHKADWDVQGGFFLFVVALVLDNEHSSRLRLAAVWLVVA